MTYWTEWCSLVSLTFLAMAVGHSEGLLFYIGWIGLRVLYRKEA